MVLGLGFCRVLGFRVFRVWVFCRVSVLLGFRGFRVWAF